MGYLYLWDIFVLTIPLRFKASYEIIPSKTKELPPKKVQMPFPSYNAIKDDLRCGGNDTSENIYLLNNIMNMHT